MWKDDERSMFLSMILYRITQKTKKDQTTAREAMDPEKMGRKNVWKKVSFLS